MKNYAKKIQSAIFQSVSIGMYITLGITGISPSSGPGGTSVTVTGTQFGPTQGSSTISFGGTNATVTSWSDTSITAIIPAGGGGLVTALVTTTSGTSNGYSFTRTASTPFTLTFSAPGAFYSGASAYTLPSTTAASPGTVNSTAISSLVLTSQPSGTYIWLADNHNFFGTEALECVVAGSTIPHFYIGFGRVDSSGGAWPGYGGIYYDSNGGLFAVDGSGGVTSYASAPAVASGTVISMENAGQAYNQSSMAINGTSYFSSVSNIFREIYIMFI